MEMQKLTDQLTKSTGSARGQQRSRHKPGSALRPCTDENEAVRRCSAPCRSAASNRGRQTDIDPAMDGLRTPEPYVARQSPADSAPNRSHTRPPRHANADARSADHARPIFDSQAYRQPPIVASYAFVPPSSHYYEPDPSLQHSAAHQPTHHYIPNGDAARQAAFQQHAYDQACRDQMDYHVAAECAASDHRFQCAAVDVAHAQNALVLTVRQLSAVYLPA